MIVKLKLLTLGALISSGSIFSQKATPTKITKLSVEDLNSTVSSISSNAPAEILYRAIYQDGSNTEFIERIKIYNKNLASEYLDKVFYYHKFAAVDEFKAVTYNLNGNIIEETLVDKKDRFKSNEDNSYIKETFAFQNVKNGSVLEFSYKASDDVVHNSFQVEESIPVRFAQYLLEIPDKYYFNVRTLGEVQPTKTAFGNRMFNKVNYRTYLYQYSDLKPYEKENYVKNQKSYMANVSAEYSSTDAVVGYSHQRSNSWNDVAITFAKAPDFGVALEKFKNLEDVNESFLNIKSEEERASQILKYVSHNYEWNGKVAASTEDGLKKLLALKKGNSAEINMLLLLLLKKNNIKSNSVVLGTIHKGAILPHVPSIKKLDYMIVAATVNNQLVLMDATSKYNRINRIHPRALTNTALMMTNKKGEFINFSAMPSKRNRKALINISGNGEVSGKITQQYDGFYAITEHESFDKNNEAYIKDLKKEWQVDLKNTDIKHNDEGVFEVKNDFTSDDEFDTSSKRVILNPLFFLKEVYKFNQTTPRRSPIEFISGFEDIVDIEVTLPEGYKLEKAFKPAKLKTDDGSINFSYNITQEGNKLLIKSNVSVAEDTYDKEYYPIFKQVFDHINKTHNESIFLVKS